MDQHEHHSSHATFPFIAIAIIGIVATALLLLTYYILVIRCCFNWHRIHLLTGHFTRRRDEIPTFYSAPVQTQGLDEYMIRSIPISRFTKSENEQSLCECAVCLNEFQQDERLRIIPNCAHMFHIDCIDVWLQRNSNCPICRTSISSNTLFPILPVIDSATDSDFIVIELGEQNGEDGSLLTVQERLGSSDLLEKLGSKKKKKTKQVLSMGDECIDTGIKDERFTIHPMRRSFSMDSAADRHLYLAVEDIVQQNKRLDDVSSHRACKSFFSFGHGRGSRNSVPSVDLEK